MNSIPNFYQDPFYKEYFSLEKCFSNSCFLCNINKNDKTDNGFYYSYDCYSCILYVLLIIHYYLIKELSQYNEEEKKKYYYRYNEYEFQQQSINKVFEKVIIEKTAEILVNLKLSKNTYYLNQSKKRKRKT